jgi:hypothetical protein
LVGGGNEDDFLGIFIDCHSFGAGAAATGDEVMASAPGRGIVDEGGVDLNDALAVARAALDDSDDLVFTFFAAAEALPPTAEAGILRTTGLVSFLLPFLTPASGPAGRGAFGPRRALASGSVDGALDGAFLRATGAFFFGPFVTGLRSGSESGEPRRAAMAEEVGDWGAASLQSSRGRRVEMTMPGLSGASDSGDAAGDEYRA